MGLELSENSIVHGGGTINVQIQGVGLGSEGNRSIVADNPGAALVLAGNVSGVASVSAASGATLTLAGSMPNRDRCGGRWEHVERQRKDPVVGGVGEYTNARTSAPGVAGGPGQVTINGYYTQTSGGAIDFTLGAARTRYSLKIRLRHQSPTSSRTA